MIFIHRDIAAPQDPLRRPLRVLPGVGPSRQQLLAKMGLFTVRDLLYYLPFRYEDRSHPTPLGDLTPGDNVVVIGRIVAVADQKLRGPKVTQVTRLTLRDRTGQAVALFFNQPYLARQLRPGQAVMVMGRADRRFGGWEISAHAWELWERDSAHAGRIVPVYQVTEGLSVRALRGLIRAALDAALPGLVDVLPEPMRARLGLADLGSALEAVHFPADIASAERGRRRLAWEELFLLELGLGMTRQYRQAREAGVAHAPDGPLVSAFFASLPFTLTPGQARAWQEIRADMESPAPMNRLLQGDVGSGKTVVAAAAMVKAVEGGYQAAMMAPTEILAEQHGLTLSRLFAPLGIEVRVLTGSLDGRAREESLAAIAGGAIPVVVGTHALIQEAVTFANLGLVITDEQHRFGVRQRAALRAKGGAPDVLVMTATPIPRTLAMTVFGDLDVSVISGLPPGRRPVQTFWFRRDQRARVYRGLAKELDRGHQGYVICPLIEESEKLQVQAATELAAELQAGYLRNYRVGLLHGRMNTAEKASVFERFRNGDIQVLVSTTVVEVGVDVPNATMIVIEEADRFGLAQLHQLRGRVGRGAAPSYCVLVADPQSDTARQRLETMCREHDGFRIAEADLALRGPGEVLGTRQSGLPDLRVADLVRDQELLVQARTEAAGLLAQDPGLRGHPLLRQAVVDMFRDRAFFASIG